MGRKKGAPAAYKPTEETRAKVCALIAFGNSHEQIARYLDISPDTLQKHFKEELRTAKVDAATIVANRLFRRATDDNDLQAQIFYLKTQGRWRSADSEAIQESNEELMSELKSLREQLDKKNMREY